MRRMITMFDFQCDTNREREHPWHHKVKVVPSSQLIFFIGQKQWLFLSNKLIGVLFVAYRNVCDNFDYSLKLSLDQELSWDLETISLNVVKYGSSPTKR